MLLNWGLLSLTGAVSVCARHAVGHLTLVGHSALCLRRFWGKKVDENDDKMQRLAADVAQERSSSEDNNNNNSSNNNV